MSGVGMTLPANRPHLGLMEVFDKATQTLH